MLPTTFDSLADCDRYFELTGFPPDIGYPDSAAEQYEIAKAIDCPFCSSKAGERCAPSLLFPQYPHTPRIQQAWINNLRAESSKA